MQSKISDKSKLEEDYDFFLREIFDYTKSNRIYLITKEDIEYFLKIRSDCQQIHNVYLNLKQQSDQENAIEDLLNLVRNYVMEKEYGIKQKSPEELEEMRQDKSYVLTGEAKKRADARLKELFTTGIKHYIYMEDLPRIRAEYEELKKLSDKMKNTNSIPY